MATQPYVEAWLPGPSSTQFYTRTYSPTLPQPTKAAIVFVHGFAEHIGRYTHFHPLLAGHGIAVFTYDQRGFGLTAQDPKNKSKTSAYGKTCWKDQMADIEWAVGHARKSFEGVPLFLMGHSMGGGEVLGFATQGEKGSHRATLSSLAGVIATSPLLEQATPASKLAKWIGGKLSALAPYTLIPAGVKAEELSHDPEINEAYLKDPLVKQSGSLKGIHDMLSKGEALLRSTKDWPQNLPALLIHGTEDKVTSHQASQTFHDNIPAAKKTITLFPGGYHELQNEPDGVKEKLAGEIIAFIDEHLDDPSTSAAAGISAIDAENPTATKAEAEPVVSGTTDTVPPIEAGPEPTGVGSARAKM
ncbi:Alpha/Beta hydrolase protein [Crassisporium funariophilum]|nr:Alpha/Beta hydrolase protein [Crassisporium funariophilum]